MHDILKYLKNMISTTKLMSYSRLNLIISCYPDNFIFQRTLTISRIMYAQASLKIMRVVAIGTVAREAPITIITLTKLPIFL